MCVVFNEICGVAKQTTHALGTHSGGATALPAKQRIYAQYMYLRMPYIYCGPPRTWCFALLFEFVMYLCTVIGNYLSNANVRYVSPRRVCMWWMCHFFCFSFELAKLRDMVTTRTKVEFTLHSTPPHTNTRHTNTTSRSDQHQTTTTQWSREFLLLYAKTTRYLHVWTCTYHTCTTTDSHHIYSNARCCFAVAVACLLHHPALPCHFVCYRFARSRFRDTR